MITNKSNLHFLHLKPLITLQKKTFHVIFFWTLPSKKFLDQSSFLYRIWRYCGFIGKIMLGSLIVDFVRAPAGIPYSKVINIILIHTHVLDCNAYFYIHSYVSSINSIWRNFEWFIIKIFVTQFQRANMSCRCHKCWHVICIHCTYALCLCRLFVSSFFFVSLNSNWNPPFRSISFTFWT